MGERGTAADRVRGAVISRTPRMTTNTSRSSVRPRRHRHRHDILQTGCPPAEQHHDQKRERNEEDCVYGCGVTVGTAAAGGSCRDDSDHSYSASALAHALDPPPATAAAAAPSVADAAGSTADEGGGLSGGRPCSRYCTCTLEIIMINAASPMSNASSREKAPRPVGGSGCVCAVRCSGAASSRRPNALLDRHSAHLAMPMRRPRHRAADLRCCSRPSADGCCCCCCLEQQQ
jgi:hypothetical protein